MPVIFVATDFSAISENAVHYGASLAREWGYELHLLHSYFMPLTFNDPAIPILPVEDLKGSADERMLTTLNSLQTSFPELTITTGVEYGDIQDNLQEAVKRVGPELIIVGSHGEADADMWMGSTTLDLLRHANCPVLAVPPNAKFIPVSRVCLALDLSNENEELSLEAISSLQQLADVSVHLLHVVKIGEEATSSIENLPVIKQLKSINVEVHIAETSGDVDTKIAEFSEAEGMQWLAVIPHHHSFWDSIFHKSHTKGMIKRSHLPVLALHE